MPDTEFKSLVVLNRCPGRFGLSRDAAFRLAEIKGVRLREEDGFLYVGDTYDRIEETVRRDDVDLLTVVAQMGEAAGASGTNLRIMEVYVSIDIESRDGYETANVSGYATVARLDPDHPLMRAASTHLSGTSGNGTDEAATLREALAKAEARNKGLASENRKLRANLKTAREDAKSHWDQGMRHVAIAVEQQKRIADLEDEVSVRQSVEYVTKAALEQAQGIIVRLRDGNPTPEELQHGLSMARIAVGGGLGAERVVRGLLDEESAEADVPRPPTP